MAHRPRARLALALLAGSGVAHAQPAPPAEPETTAPLATIKDEKQLAALLSSITSDPAIPVQDPAIRNLAQALMTEGVKQLQASAFDQALANFLEAYTKFPSPRILLNIGSTLRDMGRPADAANTYQRYLADPATGPERVAEVKQLLVDLDAQLTILTVRVTPRGSDVSIDGGPFVTIGGALVTRVRPGIHLVRVRKGEGSAEITVNGFEGENKEVEANAPTPAPPPTTTPRLVEGVGPKINPNLLTLPDQLDGWLITGTQYVAGDGNDRKTRTGFQGTTISAIVPRYEDTDDGIKLLDDDDDTKITSGVIGVLRIDGEGRGAAGGLGLAVSRGRLEGELMVLKSDSTGGYLGVRFRLLTGWLRPYVGAGVPGFAFDQVDMMGTSTTKLAIGLRGAGGIELRINGHLSVQADVGFEHFFVDPATTGLDANIVVPTLGAVGRL